MVGRFIERAPAAGRPLLGQVMEDVLVAVDALGEAALEGGTDRIVTVSFEQLVEAIHIADPDARTPMDELGEVRQGGAALAEEVLAREVPLGPLPRDCGDPLARCSGKMDAVCEAKSRSWVASKRPATMRILLL